MTDVAIVPAIRDPKLTFRQLLIRSDTSRAGRGRYSFAIDGAAVSIDFATLML